MKVVRSEPSRDLGMRIPGRKNSKCKSPEAETKLLFQGTTEVLMALSGGEHVRRKGQKSSEDRSRQCRAL